MEECVDCVTGLEFMLGLGVGIACLTSLLYAVRWWEWKQHEHMLEEWRQMVIEQQAKRAAEMWERQQKKFQKDE